MLRIPGLRLGVRFFMFTDPLSAAGVPPPPDEDDGAPDMAPGLPLTTREVQMGVSKESRENNVILRCPLQSHARGVR